MVIPERKRHIFCVRDFALLLSYIHGVDSFRVEIAALSHDLFRDVPPDRLLRLSKLWNVPMSDVEIKHPILLHGRVAAEFLRRRFSFEDSEVLMAVAYHTSGHPDFDRIGKILTVSDTVGYDRDFSGVEDLRDLAMKDLEEAYRAVLKNRIIYAVSTDRYLLEMSVSAWNRLVERR